MCAMLNFSPGKTYMHKLGREEEALLKSLKHTF
jgi:hypothetical protein